MNLKNFANSWPSASNFKFFSRSQEQFCLTVGQNNFGNKIPFFKVFPLFHKVAKIALVLVVLKTHYLEAVICPLWLVLDKERHRLMHLEMLCTYFFFNQILSKSMWSRSFLAFELLLTNLAKPSFLADILALDSSKRVLVRFLNRIL